MNETNLKSYEVTVTAKYPATGERPGVLEITAQNKAHAIKQARRQMEDAGHTRQDGPLLFEVKEML